MNRRLGRRVARGAGGAFSPSRLSPYIWLEADSGITETSNRISLWTSRVNGFGLAQGTGANQPLYVPSDAAYNNRPTVHMDSAVTAKYLETYVASIVGDWSTFEFGQHEGVGTNTHALRDSLVTGHEYNWQRSAAKQQFLAYDGASTATPEIDDAASEKRSLYRGILAASETVTLVRNGGTPVTGVATGAPVATTMNQVGVGYSATAQVQTVAAYFVFRRELSASERTRLHAWCVAKYGA